jgi:3-oxoacyl-[acyl-carrier protein] reductase
MDGRVALVTGGSRGIGRATSIALCQGGHRVVICYRQDRAGADETAATIMATGGEAVSVRADVDDPEAVDGAFRDVEASWGPVEVLVNNAGVTRDKLLLRMRDAEWSDVLRTNLYGPFHTIRRAASGMMSAGFGRIVNIGSAVGQLGSAGQANYAAAKAGLLGLTRSVARELAPYGITCNLVVTGPIATTMLDALAPERREELAKLTAIGRLGSPEDVAAVVAFLCSEAARYVTGAAVPVDGGMCMGPDGGFVEASYSGNE